MPAIALAIANPETHHLMMRALQGAGYQVLEVPVQKNCLTQLSRLARQTDALLFGQECLFRPDIEHFARQHPQIPLVLFSENDSPETWRRALQLGVVGIVNPPARYDNLHQSLRQALNRRTELRRWASKEALRSTKELRDHLDELNTLLQIGQALTAKLDLDTVLADIVDAAITFTDAEESTLLLLDEESNELYLRASRGINQKEASTLRLKVQDTLAGQVLRTGQPVLLSGDATKIKTSYLVRALIYVPLQSKGRILGVLGVDNRQQETSFTQRHVERLQALAKYAAIALDNAQLFAQADNERRKLETVLGSIQEGVLVLNEEGEILLINHTARMVLRAPEDENVVGMAYTDCCTLPEITKSIGQALAGHTSREEVTAPDGRVFSLRVIPVPGVGAAATLHDITHFKELDRIKSEFVSTVSHDLRSPLTAILGYVELLERVGPLTPMQRHFIDRVRDGVSNITALINDLLDLGRIEAGFDMEKSLVSIGDLVRETVNDLSEQIAEKKQRVTLHVADDLPTMLGSEVRLRQMINNIVHNAVKYTPPGGRITIDAENRGQQIVLTVQDTGHGIPPNELPYIFDKFFRGSNVASEQPGTGLGLAIVKSIVEAHHGRIWVESTPNKGTTFTVVLPGMTPESLDEAAS